MDFEAYLISKKIDSALFQKAEPDVWSAWKYEFEQVHPNSFTAQKLYLINPVRRKYQLKEEPAKPEVKTLPAEVVVTPEKQEGSEKTTGNLPVNPKPAVPRPIFKPKPKTT